MFLNVLASTSAPFAVDLYYGYDTLGLWGVVGGMPLLVAMMVLIGFSDVLDKMPAWRRRVVTVLGVATLVASVVLTVGCAGGAMQAEKVVPAATTELESRIAGHAGINAVDRVTDGADWSKPSDWNIDGATRICKVDGPLPHGLNILADGIDDLSLPERQKVAAAIDKVDGEDVNVVCEVGGEYAPLVAPQEGN